MSQKIIFVNGLLFPGTYPGGAGYWLGENSPFVTAAHVYLGCQPSYFADIKHHALSNVADRMQAGWQYAAKHRATLTDDLSREQDSFHFITHSMGAAFAEGMIAFFQEHDYKIGTVIHFNAFQAADIEVKRMASQTGYVIDYQNTNDPMINNPIYARPGAIKNADLTIRTRSIKPIYKRHRDPIDSEHSWQLLLHESVIIQPG